jgi:hypothetical protein
VDSGDHRLCERDGGRRGARERERAARLARHSARTRGEGAASSERRSEDRHYLIAGTVLRNYGLRLFNQKCALYKPAGRTARALVVAAHVAHGAGYM